MYFSLRTLRGYFCFFVFFLLLLVLSTLSYADAPSDTVASAVTGTPNYNRDIRPILSDNCFHCHGPDNATREKGLRLDTQEGLFSVTEDGDPVITTGKPMESALFLRMIEKDIDMRMPPQDSHKHLTDEQIDLFKQWIVAGAQWEKHWSFTKIKKSPLPKVSNESWVNNGIDAFIMARLDKESLSPEKKAARRVLIRRVSFDLTGLPPTPQAVEAFVADTSDSAYETVVDRLLASSAYGEHRSRYWLDAARYGDTHGLHLDNIRTIWPYRDWVVNAFNTNMRFDQFTIAQLAGDLIPNKTISQHMATGFNRCNPTTSEGGAINEEYLAIYATDRVETMSQVWLGLTTGCAACHDHKFDPISQKEFYQLTAFFRNTTQKAMDGNARDTPPNLMVPLVKDISRSIALTAAVKTVKQEIDVRKEARASDFDAWLPTSKTAVANMIVEIGQYVPLSLSLNEGNGDIISGVIEGKTFQAKVTGMHQWVPSGLNQKALGLSNETELVVGDHGAFDINKPFVWSFRVQLPRDKYTADIVFGSTDIQKEHKRGWKISIKDGKPVLTFLNKDRDKKLTMAKSLPAKKWHHIVITYDGLGKGDGGFKCYLNNLMSKFVMKTGPHVWGKAFASASAKPLVIGLNGTDKQQPLIVEATEATRTSVGLFYGGDDNEGLDVRGEFVYAINYSGEGGGVVGDATFTPDNIEGTSVVAQNDVPNWHLLNLGDSVSDNYLEKIVESIRWSTPKPGITITLDDLEIGHAYRLQLLFTKLNDGGFDITIEDVLVVDEFSPRHIQGKPKHDQLGVVITHDFVAKDESLNLFLGGKTAYKDSSPTISGLMLEKLDTIDRLPQIVSSQPWPAEKLALRPITTLGLSHLELGAVSLNKKQREDINYLYEYKMIQEVSTDKISNSQTDLLNDIYLRTSDIPAMKLFKHHELLVNEQMAINANETVTLVSDEKKTRATANVLTRGQYDQPGEEVYPATPAALLPYPEGAPENRLGLATWLVDPGHPLTARVTINRFWQALFGTGIVETSEDFGSQGAAPSHQPLLDWLASSFIEGGWNVKEMYKLMVMSATYQQSSYVAPQKYKHDPKNRLYARGPRFRLDAEVIRDQALFVSGLMVDQVGGPGVNPYQPAGVWKAVGYSGSNTVKFVQDHGEKLYRKSLYTFWKRTAPPSSMSVFDAPSRESCAVRRERTNTPLQALTLMNDPQFLEAAKFLAARVLRQPKAERIRYILSLALGNEPTAADIASLNALYGRVFDLYQEDLNAAKKILSVGEANVPGDLNIVEHASLMVVANCVMNLDAFITKN